MEARLKGVGASADQDQMVALMAVFAVFLAACGLGLVGVGIGMNLQGEPAGGLSLLAFGILTLYGAYLFGRESRRTRAAAAAQTPSVDEVRVRRSEIKGGVTFGLVCAGSTVFASIPGTVKVISLVTITLGVVVGLAARAAPRNAQP